MSNAGKFPWNGILGDRTLQVELRRKILSRCVYVLHKSTREGISRCSGKEVNKSVLWLIEPISFLFFLTFLLPLPSWLLRPAPHVSEYFWIRKFFLADSKIFMSTRSVFKSNLPVHKYSGFTLGWIYFKRFGLTKNVLENRYSLPRIKFVPRTFP